MDGPLIECVPNFSEGRRPEVVAQIVAAIASVGDVDVLAHESDADHNRSVVTFVGPPAAVVEAAFRGIERAAELIDLNAHQGQHPRIGAADVVPFIPLAGATLADCAQLARELGQRVGEELGLPVYLYEAAATRPERLNLADVRRGGYEALRDNITSDPDRAPDFGPARVGPAGAVAIGARDFLVAFNAYLTTDSVQIAQAVAMAVRHSSGGLRGVKALGLLVQGQAQVSMNLTDVTHTPIHRALELVRLEASRHGVTVARCELIGMVPQAALVDSAGWYLQLDDFGPERVLEVALAQQQTRRAPDLLDALAQSTPTPAGGSAVAYGGAMAAALVAMVARLTASKPRHADVADRMQQIAVEADALRNGLQDAVQADAAAFDDILAARRLPVDDPSRQSAIERATRHAVDVPLHTAEQALQVLTLAVELAESGLSSAHNDALAAASLAQTAARISALNARVNCAGLTSVDHLLARLDEILAEAERLGAQ